MKYHWTSGQFVQTAAVPSLVNVYAPIVTDEPFVPAKMPSLETTVHGLVKMTVVGELLDESPLALDDPWNSMVLAWAC